ncbi:MAG: alpha-amylase family glycosyl hydrolase [Bacteroidales bacterium]|nr:alpha-amylase family glycosyl hydrolase [Bacteroidales bacterium]
MKKILLTLALFLCGIAVVAQQAIRTVPAFVVEAAPGPTHIYFDATAPGVPESMRGFTGTGGADNFLYVHTGLVTTAGRWNHVFNPGGVTDGPWGTTHEELRMERMPESYGTHVWRFVIPNSVREFYNVTDPDERVQEIMLVIRNGAGNVEFPPGYGNDISIPVFETDFNVRMLTPPNDRLFVEGEQITFSGESSEPANLAIYINSERVAEVANDTIISFSGSFPIGSYTATLVGRLGELTQTERIFFAVRGETLDSIIPYDFADGINYHECGTAVTFIVSAPHKSHIFVIGDFNDWRLLPEFQMKRQRNSPWPADLVVNMLCHYWYVGYSSPPVGGPCEVRGFPNDRFPRDRYWLTVTGLTPGKKYAFQYIVDDTIVTTDIFSKLVLDPWNDHWIPPTVNNSFPPFPAGARSNSFAGVLQTNRPAFPWIETNFVPPPRENLVIYELLIRDFLHHESFETLLDTLTYLQRLGVNAIKLLPLNEFDGNDSWGYNPAFYFAVDKAYGTREQLKRFINEAHRRNIAVILDVVYSHSFGNSPTVQMWRQGPGDRLPGYPSPNSPYHNEIANHPFSVGENFNHCSPFTRYMVRRAIMFWMEEFRLDGFRFDLSKGFTQRQSLGNMAEWNRFDQERINNLCWYASQVRLINPNAFLIMEHFSDRDEEYHMSYWCDLMFWRNTGRAFSELAMGWPSDGTGQGGYNIVDAWNSGRNFISYMESHDEQRVPYRVLNNSNQWGHNNHGYPNPRDTTEMLLRMAATANIFLTTPPGPRMIWQFGEIGYHWPINFCYNRYTGEGHHGGEECRTGRMPIPWDLLEDPRRQNLFNVFSTLIHFRTTHPAMRFPQTAWVGTGNQGRLRWTHSQNGEHAMIAVSNLDVVTQNILVQSVPLGRYYNAFPACDVFPPHIDITSGNWQFNNIPPGRFAMFTRGSRFEIPDIIVPPYFSLNVDNQIIKMGEDINVRVAANRHTRLDLFFNDQLLVSTTQDTISHRIRQIMSVGNNELVARITSNFGTETIALNITVNETQATSITPEIVEPQMVYVFPNPVTDRLYIQSPDTPIDRVVVYDLRGRRVSERRFDTNNVVLDMSALPKGMFILRIYTGEHVIIQRIVKN